MCIAAPAKVVELDKDEKVAFVEFGGVKQRAKIDLIKAQTRKITIDDEQEEIADDGFLDALNASAKEDWEDEED